MLERRCMAHGMTNDYDSEPDVTPTISGFHLSTLTGPGAASEAALWAKQLEIKLAAANLGQAEYYLDRPKARVDYLEARAATEAGISRRELEELAWARAALPASAATLKALSDELKRGRLELEILLRQHPAAMPAAVLAASPQAEGV